MPINYLKKIHLGEYGADCYRIGPDGALESIIEGFYVFSKDPKDHTQLIFNDGFPVLVFLQHLEDTVTVTGEDDSFDIKAAWASAGAIKNVYVNYNSTTEQIFIVRFHPNAFYQLFGLDSKYFKDNPVRAFKDLAENNSFRIDKFFKCISIEEKIAFVGSYVQNSIREIETPDLLLKTLDHIHRIKGNGTVREVTNDAGVNYKWLERSFLKNIGLVPKSYIQLQRFIHAYLQLVGTQQVDLMEIAVSNGYYDSNHFLKDFKVYTGKTPLEYLKFQS
jgi:AraC-like DNA-binding protein